MSVLLLALALLSATAPGAPLVRKPSVAMARTLPEPATARDEARHCEEGEDKDDGGVAACREALRLGLREPQRTALRQLLARRLAERERFDELVELYGEDAEEHPSDSEAWRRLGAARLFLRADASSALPALEAAEKLRADDASTHVLLGLCLSSLARHEEAVAAFEAALRLDPEALSLRPAARATLDAARRGERWP